MLVSTLMLASSALAGEPLPMGISEWAGTYTCGQGLTHLALTVSRDGDGLWATFAFGPLPTQNPDIPSGSFRMTGSVRGSEVELVPGEWLVRPTNYVTVGLSGELDGVGRLRGEVEGPAECTTFSVSRVGPRAPAMPVGESEWTGSYVCRQGRTLLELDLRQSPLHELTGTFTFTPGPETPAIPWGRFALAGHLDPSTGEVFLAPGDWFVRPTGWLTVGLRGRVDGGHLSGAVALRDVTLPPTAQAQQDSGCTTFSVTRGPGAR